MPILASDVLNEVRKVWLNDQNGTLFDDNTLLPFLQSAFSDLLSELESNNISSLVEVSDVITVTAGSKTLSLPADFVSPIKLEERAAGSSDLYTEMRQETIEPDVEPVDQLLYWTFREDAIVFVGATTDRDVRITYSKSLAITGTGSTIPIIGADNYLAPRTAELAAMGIGQNPAIAQFCGTNAVQALDDLIRKKVKLGQANPVRRKPYQNHLKQIMY